MPIYTYQYIDTKETVDVMQKMCDEPLKEYNGRKVKKLPASASFNLKGKGFYKNDYAE